MEADRALWSDLKQHFGYGTGNGYSEAQRDGADPFAHFR